MGEGWAPFPEPPGVPVKREALTPQPGPGSRQRAEANLLPASRAPSKHSPAFLLPNRMKGNTGSLSPRRQKREEGWGGELQREKERKKQRDRETEGQTETKESEQGIKGGKRQKERERETKRDTGTGRVKRKERGKKGRRELA